MVLVSVLLTLAACFIVRRVEVDAVHAGPADSVQVRSPVKAHLLDGSTVVYPGGLSVAGGRVLGAGTHYDLTLSHPAPVAELALDSVVGMETFRTGTDAGATIAYSTLATAGAIALSVAIACAIDPKCFGSCPTFYSDSAGNPVLEAEGFSYSIAPLFEARDVDRLRVRAGPDGQVRLEIRNEAFETHYINHLALLETRHNSSEIVAPDPRGQPVAVRGLVSPATAFDRRRRDVLAQLTDADGITYRTDSTTLAGVRLDDYQDELDLSFPRPAGGDSLALVLRLRNSLLNTVLLYDIMLGDPGARSLDWQAEQLQQVGPALELGTWYAGHMGLRVSIEEQGAYREVARIKDTGPVAWKDVVVPLHAGSGDSVRVRLSFVADNWRIDRAALAGGMRRLPVRVLPLARVLGRDDAAEPEALEALAAPDGRYLQTSAGQYFQAVWEVGPAPTDEARTFLLASQGYYIEWVRRGWIAAARDTTTFVPGDTALLKTLSRWRTAQDTLEARFFATRVPVR
jgi:hypothetical protein